MKIYYVTSRDVFPFSPPLLSTLHTALPSLLLYYFTPLKKKKNSFCLWRHQLTLIINIKCSCKNYKNVLCVKFITFFLTGEWKINGGWRKSGGGRRRRERLFNKIGQQGPKKKNEKNLLYTCPHCLTKKNFFFRFVVVVHHNGE